MTRLAILVTVLALVLMAGIGLAAAMMVHTADASSKCLVDSGGHQICAPAR